MKQDKKQYWAVLFNDGEVVLNVNKYSTAAEVIGHTMPDGDAKFYMAKPLGTRWPKTTEAKVMLDPKGWVNKFGKPITTSMAKFNLSWARTKAFKHVCINRMRENDWDISWHRAKVWNVDGLTPLAKRKIKVGQIVELTFRRMPQWYDDLEAFDGRGEDSLPVVVPVVYTGKTGKRTSLIVGEFTAHII